MPSYRIQDDRSPKRFLIKSKGSCNLDDRTNLVHQTVSSVEKRPSRRIKRSYHPDDRVTPCDSSPGKPKPAQGKTKQGEVKSKNSSSWKSWKVIPFIDDNLGSWGTIKGSWGTTQASLSEVIPFTDETMGSVDEVGTTEGNISATSEGTLENFQTTFHSIIESPRVKAVGSLVSTYVSSKIDRAKELFISTDECIASAKRSVNSLTPKCNDGAMNDERSEMMNNKREPFSIIGSSVDYAYDLYAKKDEYIEMAKKSVKDLGPKRKDKAVNDETSPVLNKGYDSSSIISSTIDFASEIYARKDKYIEIAKESVKAMNLNPRSNDGAVDDEILKTLKIRRESVADPPVPAEFRYFGSFLPQTSRLQTDVFEGKNNETKYIRPIPHANPLIISVKTKNEQIVEDSLSHDVSEEKREEESLDAVTEMLKQGFNTNKQLILKDNDDKDDEIEDEEEDEDEEDEDIGDDEDVGDCVDDCVDEEFNNIVMEHYKKSEGTIATV